MKVLLSALLSTLAFSHHPVSIEFYLSDREEPLEIRKDNIFTLVLDKTTMLPMKCDKGFFLKFYSPYCPHCNKMKEDWVAFHKLEKDNVHVVSIDCTSNESA
jgi:thiol-disulfide isomerase/thioredoxin